MSISTARIRRECEGGGFCHEMAYEVCRERDAQAAEIEAAWKMIESEFDIEPRAQIEAEAKTNGFKYGLAQAIHAIWKRDAKVSGLTAVRTAAAPFEDSRPVDEATIREVYKDDEITTLHYRQGGKQLRIDRKEYSFSFGVMSDGGVFYGPFRIKTIGQLNHLLAALKPGGVK